MKWLLRLAIVVLLTMVVPGPSYADFLLTFNDSTDTLTWVFDGLPPFSCTAETCVAIDTFTGFVSTGVDLRFNIFDPGGVTLSDTLRILAPAGSDTFTSTFISDVDGGPPLTALLGATTLIEDGT